LAVVLPDVPGESQGWTEKAAVVNVETTKVKHRLVEGANDMSSKQIVSLLPAVTLVAIGMAGPATADVRLRLYTHSDGANLMGQVIPETNDTNTVWFSSNKACWRLGDTASYLLDAETGMMYMLNHPAKQYAEMKLGEVFGADSPELQQMLAMMKMEVTVEPTDEKMKIGDWDCRKFFVTKKMPMAVTTSSLWATKDIELDSEAYHQIMTATMAYFPNYLEIVEQYKKIGGVIVKEETAVEVMGQKLASSSELIDQRVEKAPEGTYSIPDDYERVAAEPPGLR
jgi:hypothetical protein